MPRVSWQSQHRHNREITWPDRPNRGTNLHKRYYLKHCSYQRTSCMRVHVRASVCVCLCICLHHLHLFTWPYASYCCHWDRGLVRPCFIYLFIYFASIVVAIFTNRSLSAVPPPSFAVFGAARRPMAEIRLALLTCDPKPLRIIHVLSAFYTFCA